MAMGIEIAKLMRGGLEVMATILKFGIDPTLTLVLGGGFAVGGLIEFVMYPPQICVNCFVDIFFIKFCKAGFIKLPCGFDWMRLVTFQASSPD